MSGNFSITSADEHLGLSSMLELALKVGTELMIVLASNGDVRGDAINVIRALC